MRSLTSEAVGAAFKSDGKKSARVSGRVTERIAAVIKNFIVAIDYRLCIKTEERNEGLSLDFISFS